jgi:hypothetical protein
VKIRDHTLICHDFSDALLLNHHRLKSMDATPHTDHHSVFKWIWQKKPLDNGEFNWIFHPGDFVSMISPRKNRFENSIRRYLHSSAPALKVRTHSSSKSPQYSQLGLDRASSNQQAGRTKRETLRWNSSVNPASTA